jgi:hypothetical protein
MKPLKTSIRHSEASDERAKAIRHRTCIEHAYKSAHFQIVGGSLLEAITVESRWSAFGESGGGRSTARESGQQSPLAAMPPTTLFSLGICKRREDATAKEREEVDRARQRSLAAAQGLRLLMIVCVRSCFSWLSRLWSHFRWSVLVESAPFTFGQKHITSESRSRVAVDYLKLSRLVPYPSSARLRTCTRPPSPVIK